MIPQPERTPLAAAIRFATGIQTREDADILALHRPGSFPTRVAARIIAEELERVRTSHEHARQLLLRWRDWARAHGYDIGILDDTRTFLRSFPKP